MFSKEIGAEIRKLRDKEKTYEEIADAVGLSRAQVKSYCNYHKIGGCDGRHKMKKLEFTPEREVEIIQMRESGKSLDYIAAEVGCSYTGIWKWLNAHNVEKGKATKPIAKPEPKPKPEPLPVVTKRCNTCKWRGKVGGGTLCCDYCYQTDRLRGCPPGDRCTRYVEGPQLTRRTIEDGKPGKGPNPFTFAVRAGVDNRR